MSNLAIGKNVALKVLHKLVHSNLELVCSQVDDLQRLYMGIERSPLASPVSPYFLFADDLAALRRLGPAHIVAHECQGAAYIPFIKAAYAPIRVLVSAGEAMVRVY